MMITSHNDVIRLLGGPIQAAAKLKQKADTVRRWRLRNNIPRAHWFAVARLVKGVTVERLAATAAEDRRAA